MKKVKCPKCKEEINSLINVQNVWVSYYAELDKNGDIQYEGKDRWDGNTDENGYDCPNCDETLFTSEEEAINFLKGR